MLRFAINVFLLTGLIAVWGCQGETQQAKGAAEPGKTNPAVVEDQLVEASCGQCQFGMKGTGCSLAVRIDGQAYFVDGSSIDEHGDAHGDDGMCNCIRQARVSGEIKDGRFVATSFTVLPQESDEGTGQ